MGNITRYVLKQHTPKTLFKPFIAFIAQKITLFSLVEK